MRLIHCIRKTQSEVSNCTWIASKSRSLHLAACRFPEGHPSLVSFRRLLCSSLDGNLSIQVHILILHPESNGISTTLPKAQPNTSLLVLLSGRAQLVARLVRSAVHEIVKQYSASQCRYWFPSCSILAMFLVDKLWPVVVNVISALLN